MPALGGRATLRLPYVWSPTRVRRDGDRYEVRVGERHLRLRIGDPVEPDPLELFLTDRRGLHTRLGGRTVHLPLAHAPWTLHRALFSAGVDDACFGPPTVVSRA